ncbi:MAG TPA: DegT/DnrJ/EryC1/StrS aminotransferase family protein [Bauldia sp.]|nr:DegT/DnrJ/EryC1/StrS aminotransferase family protein [Bauldia sp.]
MTPSRPALTPVEGKIPLFDIQRQRARLEKDIRQRMDAVLAHGQFILGPEVDEFERQLAAFCGAGHAIAVSSGRDALMIALMAMGVKQGDAVFVPAFTFAATAGAVVAVGATPVFVDVEASTFNMDPADLERAIAETKRAGVLKPSAVMPVDLYGQPADYPAINRIAESSGLTVLADAAQSFGGSLGNRRVGTLAPVSATSFYPTKPLGCYGDGGAVLAEDARVAEQVRLIRSHGRAGSGDEALVLGLTGRLDTLQAAILLSKLTAFPDELERRAAIAACYTAGLSRAVRTPSLSAGAASAWALYTIRVSRRDEVRAALEARGIGTGLFYRLALHQHPAFAGLNARPLPVSEQLANEVLSLPMGPDFRDDEIDRVIAAVNEAVGG